MNEKTYKLTDKVQTIEAIYNLAYQYYADLDEIYLNGTPLSYLSVKNYYDYIRLIPYKMDKEPDEIIGRPKRLIQLSAMDCKKKTCMLSAYAVKKQIPFHLVVVSQRKDREFHHIFPEFKVNNKWVSFDATYAKYRIGQYKSFTAKEVY